MCAGAYIWPIRNICTLHYLAYWFRGFTCVCKIKAPMCKIICKIIAQGAYLSYYAYAIWTTCKYTNNMHQYAKTYALMCKTICKIIAQGAYLSYFAYFHMQNMSICIRKICLFAYFSLPPVGGHLEAVPNQESGRDVRRKWPQRSMLGHWASGIGPVAAVAIKDQNESARAALLTPMDGTPITWIRDQRNSNGSSMYRMDQQRYSGLA